MSSHSSCLGVENIPNFGSEKMVHVVRAPSLSACFSGDSDLSLGLADALFPGCACVTPGHVTEHAGGVK